MYSTTLDFTLFTDEQLNSALVKIKAERLKVMDNEPVHYKRLLNLTHQIEDVIRERAKAKPINQEEFLAICGL